jgi:hypothetical protein
MVENISGIIKKAMHSSMFLQIKREWHYIGRCNMWWLKGWGKRRIQ